MNERNSYIPPRMGSYNNMREQNKSAYELICDEASDKLDPEAREVINKGYKASNSKKKFLSGICNTASSGGYGLQNLIGNFVLSKLENEQLKWPDRYETFLNSSEVAAIRKNHSAFHGDNCNESILVPTLGAYVCMNYEP